MFYKLWTEISIGYHPSAQFYDMDTHPQLVGSMKMNLKPAQVAELRSLIGRFMDENKDGPYPQDEIIHEPSQ